MTGTPSPRPEEPGDVPPFGGSWRLLYAGVLLNLALLVALLSILSGAFR